MFTDMVGYTARTQSDEKGSLRLLREQEELVRPLLENFHGRTVKSTGDGFLVEFPSALQAMESAIAIQEALHARNAVEGRIPIELRIGIHLGDVEQRDVDIFGDAVNIASRIQPLADAGGIAISEQVYAQVRNKIDRPLERMGAPTLKGVRTPVEVYRIVLPWSLPSVKVPTPTAPNRIAVLPFSNISPDPKDAYFSDGLTEEVISVLSELRELRVIARTSVDAYKSAPKPIPQVGTELGVGWVLEGSVRKAGTRLRITVQLVEVSSQEHAWAQTYDRELDDVFAVQSEMAKKVADALKIKLVATESARLEGRPAPNADSYLEYLQGRTLMRGIEEAELRRALAHFERALELDETNAAAHAGLADAHEILGALYYHLPTDEWRAAAQHHADRAIELDPNLAEAHAALASVLHNQDQFAPAEAELRRAIALNPSYAGAHTRYALLVADRGDPEAALRELAIAEQLDPLSTLILAEEVGLLADVDRMDDAEAKLARLSELEQDGIFTNDRRAGLADAQDDFVRYRQALDRFSDLLPGRPEIAAARAYLAARTGDPAQARALLTELEALAEPERPDMMIARVYWALGDLDRTFDWLGVAVDHQRFAPRYWRYQRRLEALRVDPRYSALLRRLNVS
jgi:adenylate cyclase